MKNLKEYYYNINPSLPDKFGYLIIKCKGNGTEIIDFSYFTENYHLNKSMEYDENEYIKIRFRSIDDVIEFIKNNLDKYFYYSTYLSDENKERIIEVFETYGDLL